MNLRRSQLKRAHPPAPWVSSAGIQRVRIHTAAIGRFWYIWELCTLLAMCRRMQRGASANEPTNCLWCNWELFTLHRFVGRHSACGAFGSCSRCRRPRACRHIFLCARVSAAHVVSLAGHSVVVKDKNTVKKTHGCCVQARSA